MRGPFRFFWNSPDGLICEPRYAVSAGIAAGSALFAVYFGFEILRTKLRTTPRGYSTPKSSSYPRKSSVDCTRDAFKIRKLPEEIDYIVVGSGIGGLFTAALLAKVGKRVVVLEQHYVTGGCTHVFEDKGYEFDTGLHYVGRIEKYRVLLDLVSGPNRVKWSKIGNEADNFCYDEIKLGNDDPVKFPAGEALWKKQMASMFPGEENAIEEYVSLVKKVNKLADMYFYGKLFHPLIQ